MLERIKNLFIDKPIADERPPSKPKGHGGPTFFAGMIDDDRFEYQSQLRTRSTRLEEWRQMRLSDARTSLLYYLPLIAVTMSPAKVEKAIAPEGVENSWQKIYDEQAAFTEWNLLKGGMKKSWTAMVTENMIYLADGYAVFEPCYKLHPEKKKYYLHWAYYRPPDSIAAWRVKDDELYEVVQAASYGDDGGPEVTMKASDLLIFTYLQLGNNFEGESIFRAAWKHWKMKFANEKIECIVNERFSGTPVLGWDKDKVRTDYKTSEDGKQTDIVIDGNTMGQLKTMMQGLRVHEKGYFIRGGMDLEYLTPSGNVPDVRATIRGHEEDIAWAGLQQFLTIGTTAHGSKSAGETMYSPFGDSIDYLIDYVYGQWNHGPAKKLIDYNWPKHQIQLYPKITASFGDVNEQEFADTVLKLVTAGYPADSPFYRWVASMIGAPEPQIDEEEQKAKSVVVPKGGTPGEGEKDKKQEFKEFKTWRALRPEERHCAFGDIVESLNKFRRRLTLQLDKVRDKQILWVRDHIKGMTPKQLDTPQIIEPEEIPHMDQYQAVAVNNFKSTVRYGRDQVKAEVRRMGRKVKAADNLGETIITFPARVFGDRYVMQDFSESEFLAYLGEQLAVWHQNWFVQSVLNNARQEILSGADSRTVANSVYAALREASRSGREAEIGRYINQSFGFGRGEEFKNQGVKKAQRSAAGDENVCDVCRGKDGNEYDVPSAEYFADYLPDRDCEGGDRCRCVHIILD